MSSWTDHLIASEPSPRVHEPKPGRIYFASTAHGPLWVEFAYTTNTHFVVLCRFGAFSLRRSETTLYLRQPTRTN